MSSFVRGKKAGLSSVLIVLLLIVFVLFLAIAIEWGRVFRTKQELQQWCDAAALAGAQSAPDELEVNRKATQFYAKNVEADPPDIPDMATLNSKFPKDSDGFRNYTFNVDGDGDGDVDFVDQVRVRYPEPDVESEGFNKNIAVQVRACRDVKLFFSALVGFEKFTVCARAIALKGGVPAPGVLGKDVSFHGANNTFASGMRVEGDLTVGGSGNTGTVEVGGTATISPRNDITVIPVEPQPLPPLPISLDFLKQQAQAAGTFFNTNQRFNSNTLPNNAVIYVEGGDIDLNLSGGSFKVTLVSVQAGGKGGNINLRGAGFELKPFSTFLLMFATTLVRVDGNGERLEGLIASPEGTVRYAGGSIDFPVTLFGDTVEVNISNTTFTTNPNILLGPGAGLWL